MNFTANAPCFSTDFARVLLILGIMKWLLFIFSFCPFWNYYEIEERRKLLWTGKFEKFELKKQVKNFVEKYCRYCFLFVKRMKADRPLLEPVMTRVSAPSKVSWGLHSTRYVQQQPTWSPGVAGRCPGPRAILRARQRHGLTPDLLLSSPGIQRTRASNTFEPENFPEFSTN